MLVFFRVLCDKNTSPKHNCKFDRLVVRLTILYGLEY